VASVDKRPNGRWRARWREHPNAPQRAKHFDRKIDAEQWLAKVMHELATGNYIAPTKTRVTFDDFKATHLERQVWKPATASVAHNALDHASKVFGPRPLGSIRKGDVQAFVARLDLAPSTVATVHQHLSGMLEAAADDGFIPRNPARRVKLPERPHADLVPPTAEQVARLFEAAPEWFRAALVLGAGCGLRQAEVAGLTVDRIDFLRRTIRVDRQWISRKGHEGFASPKSSSSTRTIPASDTVLEQLAQLIGRRSDGFVVTVDGTATHANRFNYTWSKTTKQAGQELRFHECRHTFASALISAGCSVRAVASALGHSSPSTTLRVYAHLWPGDEDRIREAIERMFHETAEDSLRTERGS
jgi:integrase